MRHDFDGPAAIDDHAILDLTYLNNAGCESQRSVRPQAFTFLGLRLDSGRMVRPPHWLSQFPPGPRPRLHSQRRPLRR